MEVTAIGANTSSPVERTSRAKLDYDAFLTLLIAQLRTQDPTNPTDSAEYISQLASFSNVEQAIKSNEKLDALITSIALTQANDAIGRTVSSADGSVSGKVASVRVASDGAIALLDDGREVRLVSGITVS